MANKQAALRKNQQIAKANRTMFIWVAIVSAVVGFAAVGAIFLTQKLVFNQKVLNEKLNTVSVLQKNNTAVQDLKNNIRVLDTNSALNSIKAKPEDQALQVVLDALPSVANSSALGASLQQKLITGINGLKQESLTVDPVAGVENNTDAAIQDASASSATQTANTINFRLVVSADNPNPLKEMLTRFERSIRAITITSLTLESASNRLTLTVDGQAFYQPGVQVQLKDKVVKP